MKNKIIIFIFLFTIINRYFVKTTQIFKENIIKDSISNFNNEICDDLENSPREITKNDFSDGNFNKIILKDKNFNLLETKFPQEDCKLQLKPDLLNNIEKLKKNLKKINQVKLVKFPKSILMQVDPKIITEKTIEENLNKENKSFSEYRKHSKIKTLNSKNFPGIISIIFL